MLLKRRVRKKDGKEHVYYALCESLRVHTGRVVQRQVLQLGELNTTQKASWQRPLEIINEEDGVRLQRRLYTDRDGAAHCETRAPSSGAWPGSRNATGLRRFLLRYELREGYVEWEWDRGPMARISLARRRLPAARPHWPGQSDPAALWAAYILLTAP